MTKALLLLLVFLLFEEKYRKISTARHLGNKFFDELKEKRN